MNWMLRYLRVINRAVAGTALAVGGGLVTTIAAVVAAGVFWRYVLNNSLAWTEEVARYLLIWLAAVGSIVAMHRREHVAITILPDALSGRAGRAVRCAIAVIIVVTCLLMTYFGWILAWNAWGQTASSFRMPLFFATAAIPVATTGFTLMAIEQAIAAQLADEPDIGDRA